MLIELRKNPQSNYQVIKKALSFLFHFLRRDNYHNLLDIVLWINILTFLSLDKKRKRGGKNIRKKKLGRMERILSKFFKFVFIDYLKDTIIIIIKMSGAPH